MKLLFEAEVRFDLMARDILTDKTTNDWSVGRFDYHKKDALTSDQISTLCHEFLCQPILGWKIVEQIPVSTCWNIQQGCSVLVLYCGLSRYESFCEQEHKVFTMSLYYHPSALGPECCQDTNIP
jgi:hypothetical protein